MAACAVPVLLLMEPGPASLISVIAAGVAGAVIGAAAGARSTLADIARTVAAARA
jgi:hypothetical protein